MSSLKGIAAVSLAFMATASAEAADYSDLQNHPVVPTTKYTECARESLRTYLPGGQVMQEKINDPTANLNGVPYDNGVVYQMIMPEGNGLEVGIDIFTVNGQEYGLAYAFRGNRVERRTKLQDILFGCISSKSSHTYTP